MNENSDAVWTGLTVGNGSCVVCCEYGPLRGDKYAYGGVHRNGRIRFKARNNDGGKKSQDHLRPKNIPVRFVSWTKSEGHQRPYVAVSVHGERSQRDKRQVEGNCRGQLRCCENVQSTQHGCISLSRL